MPNAARCLPTIPERPTAFQQRCPTLRVSELASNGKSVAENFRSWFRHSKVVDSAGSPLVVFHGTDQDFAAFDKSHIGSNFRADDVGFFFTSDPKSASDYAENDTVGLNKRPGGRVIAAYISLQRPLVIDDALLRSEGMHPLGVKEDTISFWDTYQSLVLEWARARRADGVILVDHSYQPRGEPTRMVVAFEPHQIKSALSNSGLYKAFSGDLVDMAPAPSSVQALRSSAARRQKACA